MLTGLPGLKWLVGICCSVRSTDEVILSAFMRNLSPKVLALVPGWPETIITRYSMLSAGAVLAPSHFPHSVSKVEKHTR